LGDYRGPPDGRPLLFAQIPAGRGDARRGGGVRPQAALGRPGRRGEAGEQAGEGVVGCDRQRLRVALSEQQRVPEGPVPQPRVGEQPAVAVARLRVAGQPQGAPGEPVLGERGGRRAVWLDRPPRGDRLRSVHADQADSLAAPGDGRLEGVAVDHPGDPDRQGPRGWPRPGRPLGRGGDQPTRPWSGAAGQPGGDGQAAEQGEREARGGVVASLAAGVHADLLHGRIARRRAASGTTGGRPDGRTDGSPPRRPTPPTVHNPLRRHPAVPPCGWRTRVVPVGG